MFVFYSEAMLCSELPYSEHRSNCSSGETIVDTVVELTCDDGYVFPDGSIELVASCTTNGAQYPSAVWNISEVACKRKFNRTSHK